MATSITLLVLLIVGVTAIAAQKRTTFPPGRLPANKLCRGEFDCTDPEECQRGYCIRVPNFCRWPGKPYFGTLQPDEPEGYNFGETVEFSCNPGYRLVGERSSLCTEGGEWRPRQKPRCVATRCSNPGRPYRGTITQDKQWYALGDIVQIRCKSAYLLSGSRTTSCREDGTWSHELPKCNKPTQ